jgi:hypothetical protein
MRRKQGWPNSKGVVAAALKVHFEHRGNNSGEVLGRGELRDFVRPFFETLPFIKTNGFREEREYRMVALAYRRGDLFGSEVTIA